MLRQADGSLYGLDRILTICFFFVKITAEKYLERHC